jgi:cyclic-di-GMP phosphodiesterase, flagellum assembly factor TipF
VRPSMVLIAGSLGLILYLTFGFARLEAGVIAVAALTGLMLVNAVATRTRDLGELGDKIADLSRGTADLARQVAEIGRRLATAEAEVALMSNRAQAAVEPLSAEIEKLGNLVAQLASSVATPENALALMVDEQAPGAPPDLQPTAPAAPAINDKRPAVEAVKLADPESDPIGQGRFKGMTRDLGAARERTSGVAQLARGFGRRA